MDTFILMSSKIEVEKDQIICVISLYNSYILRDTQITATYGDYDRNPLKIEPVGSDVLVRKTLDGHHKEISLEITSKTLPSKGISRKVCPQNGNFKI